MTLMSKDVPTSSVVDSFENQSARYPDYENIFKGGTKIGVGINKPLHTDIICGRGKMTTSHPANRRFRQLIDTHKFSYQNSKRRDGKILYKEIKCLIKIDDEHIHSGLIRTTVLKS